MFSKINTILDFVVSIICMTYDNRYPIKIETDPIIKKENNTFKEITTLIVTVIIILSIIGLVVGVIAYILYYRRNNQSDKLQYR